ncbi:tRNA modification GTPase [uncultured Maribacter sp.]|uniref:tRNA modification GTPase n=1 Tax=uncultured Maribacter sp. TaxID=431308 RepID=UPI002637A32A|nr:tRNA modification GTPase [uncultured Maribacter sp.]
MKRKLLFILITTISISCYAQINFEKGYFMTSANEKTECFIRNVDWLDNPTEFEYRLLEGGEKKIGNINLVKEFGIYNESKFIRRIVNIDTSSEKLGKISSDKNPIFKEEQLFLKVLIESKASLYSYNKKGSEKFFFSINDSDIEQLIFKSYEKSPMQIAKNNKFRNQLWEGLKCSEFSMDKIKDLDYKKNELVNFFIEYNNCNNSDYVNYKKNEKELFNFSIRPGINNSSIEISTFNGYPVISNVDFGSKLSFRLGVEAEFVLPFNKNKWAIILEPTYQYFKSDIEVSAVNGMSPGKIDYKSIELPVGIRHYMFLNKNSKIFINACYVFDFSNSNSLIHLNPLTNFEIESSSNFAFGLGYKYKNKYSLEFRYFTDRELLQGFVYRSAVHKNISVIFGYTIF